MTLCAFPGGTASPGWTQRASARRRRCLSSGPQGLPPRLHQKGELTAPYLFIHLLLLLLLFISDYIIIFFFSPRYCLFILLFMKLLCAVWQRVQHQAGRSAPGGAPGTRVPQALLQVRRRHPLLQRRPQGTPWAAYMATTANDGWSDVCVVCVCCVCVCCVCACAALRRR
jgi:hypothetical protein